MYKVDASKKMTTTTTTMARTLATKEMDGNLIPPWDASQKNGTNDGGGRPSGNDNVDYNNARPGDGGPASMIDDRDD
jgi:hypothetical protein